MFFMLAGAVDRFHLLQYGLSVVLIFVGLKMVWLNQWYGGKFPITYSLGFIGAVIAASVLLSLLQPRGHSPAQGTRQAPLSSMT
jgi:tellurite resistance protein TerC